MSFYHTAQVCLNGHMITDSVDEYPEQRKSFCPRCGARTITNCPSCQSPIHGNYDCGIVVIGFDDGLDSYCYNCGKPYPWIVSALEATSQLIMEESSLDNLSKNALVDSLPDIISETPKTRLASVRLKKCLSSFGSFAADGIRQFVIDFGCELAIKIIGF